MISFLKNRPAISVEPGVNLMKSLLDAGIPVASSCDGDGVCGKCKITITQGAENLSPANDLEKFLHEKFKVAPNARISCQTKVQGDITVDATYW